MEFLIWETVPVGNVCRLDSIEKVERERDLRRGVAFGTTFPKDAQFRMSKDHKKETGLDDVLPAGHNFKVCSRRLVDFLREHKLKNVEYLAVGILDHKARVASKDYAIVHPVVLQDALDLEASKPRYNRILKTKIDKVERLVLDPARLDPEVRIFRLAGLTVPVFVEARLAQEMERQNFVGAEFIPLGEYEQ